MVGVATASRPRALSVSYLTDTLPTLLPPIFDQAQHSTANHRKNLVSLRKIQDACAGIVEPSKGGMVKPVGEKAFNGAFIDMVNRVLLVKKGVAVADRVVKFVASFVAYTTEQDAAHRPEDQDEEDEEETPASRFVLKLLKHLLSGMEAKDKNVRFRVTLLTVSMINGLGSLDDDIYVVLRKCLLDRARDKEAAVRVQAALGLAKLASGEDENDLEEGQEALGEVLLDMLRYDPAPEVRRAALYNLPLTPSTMPHILSRTRDIDPILRKTVFHGSLGPTGMPDARVLSIAQREDVVRNGLGDREGSVRKAAAGMLGGWLDQAEGDILAFLDRFDVVSSQVAEEALLSVFVTRPEVFDQVEFKDEFWSSLTPEKAFLARVYVDHCVAVKNEARLEESIPVVTSLAVRIAEEYNKIVRSEDDETEQSNRAFIVGELLRLAINLDYADEIGRRKMFNTTRDMISQEQMPEELIPRCLDILAKITNGERDLIRVVVDVVTELREGEGQEESDTPADSQMSAYSATPRASRKSMAPAAMIDMNDPEARAKAAAIDYRCLLICISLLERVHSMLQDNSVFHGLLPDLILPAARNNEEPALRDQGLICLGLCCMIDSKMAADSFPLFIHQLRVADDELKVKVAQILFDLLMVQDIQEVMKKLPEAIRFVDIVRLALTQDAPAVQAVACEGTAKLMLAGMISDESILQSLVLLYFSPETVDNQALRQCLTYFLPVYCYSAPENQRRMLAIFSETFSMLAQLWEDVGDDSADMLPLQQVGLMMVDWLDPEKAVGREGVKSDPEVHLSLSLEILKSILTDTSRENRKALVSFLGKLNMPEPEETEGWKIKCLIYLIFSIKNKRAFTDATSRNALNRFDASLQKKYASELEGFDVEGFSSAVEGDRAEMVAIVDFAEAVEEMDIDAQSEVGSSRRGGKRPSKRSTRDNSLAPSESVTEISDQDEDEEEDASPPPPSKGKAKGKAAAPSRAKSKAPAKKAPARKSKKRKDESSEEDESEPELEEDEEEEDEVDEMFEEDFV